MYKIKHMDELPTEDFVYAMNLLMYPTLYTKQERSEKLDGMNISFGVNSDGMKWVKTKNGNFIFDVDNWDTSVPSLKYAHDFHVDLMESSNYVPANKDVYFNIELLPYNKTNTIEYNISNGFMIIDYFVKGVRQNWYPALNILNRTQIHKHILPNTKIEISDVIKDWLDFDYNSKPKKEIKSIVQNLQKQVKADVIKQLQFKSNFGNVAEGIILREGDFVCKIVDKTMFSEDNKSTHKFINELKQIELKLRKHIISDVFQDFDLLLNLKKLRGEMLLSGIVDEIEYVLNEAEKEVELIDNLDEVWLNIKSHYTLPEFKLTETDAIVHKEIAEYIWNKLNIVLTLQQITYKQLLNFILK